MPSTFSVCHLRRTDDRQEGVAMPKVVLKLKLNSVSKVSFSMPGFSPQGTPTNIDGRVQTDDIIEINGKTVSPGTSTHSGFCFRLREPAVLSDPDLWLCQAGYVLPGVKKKHFRNGGQIEARGILDFSPGAPQGIVAITGGTRDYRRASGEIKFFPTYWELTIFTP
jgi:hypothetical protein